MASNGNPKNPAPGAVTDWARITTNYERGDALRAEPYIQLSRAGAIEAGAAATELAQDIAESRGLSGHQWAFDFHVSVRTAQVACTPIPLPQATKGSGLVRWYAGHGSPRAAWHIGGVFKEYRRLRPKSDVKCLISRGTGPDGLPALIIPVGTNLSTVHQSRGRREKSGPSLQAAPADNAQP